MSTCCSCIRPLGAGRARLALDGAGGRCTSHLSMPKTAFSFSESISENGLFSTPEVLQISACEFRQSPPSVIGHLDQTKLADDLLSAGKPRRCKHHPRHFDKPALPSSGRIRKSVAILKAQLPERDLQVPEDSPADQEPFNPCTDALITPRDTQVRERSKVNIVISRRCGFDVANRIRILFGIASEQRRQQSQRASDTSSIAGLAVRPFSSRRRE